MNIMIYEWYFQLEKHFQIQTFIVYTIYKSNTDEIKTLTRKTQKWENQSAVWASCSFSSE